MAKENFAQHDIISPHGYTYPAWKEIKESSILNEDHIGKRVFVAGFKIPKKFYLFKVHKAGDPHHKEDAYSVTTIDGIIRTFHYDRCRLHPCEYRKGKRWAR